MNTLPRALVVITKPGRIVGVSRYEVDVRPYHTNQVMSLGNEGVYWRVPFEIGKLRFTKEYAVRRWNYTNQYAVSAEMGWDALKPATVLNPGRF